MANGPSYSSSEIISVHGDLRFILAYRDSEEPVGAPELFHSAWDEFLELQVVDKETWVQAVLSRMALLPWRYEMGIHDGVQAAGGVILGPDDDIHVGPCISVFAQYVLPEHRNRGTSLRCMRLAERTAKHLGYKVLAYTHRCADWRYETIYRRVR